MRGIRTRVGTRYKIQDHFINPLRKLLVLPYDVLYNKTLHQVHSHVVTLSNYNPLAQTAAAPIHSKTFFLSTPASSSPHLHLLQLSVQFICLLVHCVRMAVGMDDSIHDVDDDDDNNNNNGLFMVLTKA